MPKACQVFEREEGALVLFEILVNVDRTHLKMAVDDDKSSHSKNSGL